jgi:membrane-bound serine protease (ClpP class)
MKRTYLIVILAIVLLPLFATAQTVISIHIDGSINPASADFIHKAINHAAEKKAEALLIH